MKLPDSIQDLIQKYPGRSAGTALGCIIGIFLLTLGPKRTLILFLFTVLGLIIGNLFDSHISLPGINLPFGKKNKPKDDADTDIDLD